MKRLKTPLLGPHTESRVKGWKRNCSQQAGARFIRTFYITINDFDVKNSLRCSQVLFKRDTLYLTVIKAAWHFLYPFLSFQFKIRAGTRDPEKCKHLNELEGVTVVKAQMGDELGLIKAFEGSDYLFLVTPPVMMDHIFNLLFLEI